MGFVFALTCFCATSVYAQKASIKAIVKDTAAKRNLEYAVIALFNSKDSILITSIRSSHDGSFNINELKAGSYNLLITYPQMADFIVELNCKENDTINIGTIIMTSKYRLLEEVVVKSTQAAIRMKGDTLEYKADSFLVKQGASVEDLLKRLPGIQVNRDGTIKAQGEKVTQIFVDGDEFFADDPTLATKYLQANAVDKIQVYDQKSEQATFTGIDDGKRSKTINIKLKENSKKGYFGRLSAGSNAKDFYSNEGMLNKFNNKQKISVFSATSNTVTTNTSFFDRMQFIGSDFESINDNSAGLVNFNEYDGEGYYGSGQPKNFNLSTQFSNKWNAHNQRLNGSYYFNTLTIKGIETNKSTQLLPDSSIVLNDNSSTSKNFNRTQRVSINYEIGLDSFSTIKVYSRFNAKDYANQQEIFSTAINGKTLAYLNQSNQQEYSDGRNTGLNNSIVWQRRFRKKGRTVSINIQQSSDNQNGLLQTEANNLLYDTTISTVSQEIVAQQQYNKSLVNAYASKINYTEKFTKMLSLQVSYAYKLTNTKKERMVFEKNSAGKYELLIDSLSSTYSCNISSHLPSFIVQINSKKYDLSAGGDIVFTTLKQSGFNLNFSDRSFINFSPKVNLQAKFSQLTSLNIRYNGHTRQPSVEQLQPLKDKSNSLMEVIGNPNLKPSFYHNFSINFFKYSLTSFSNIQSSISYSFTQNAIASNQTYEQFNKTKIQYVNISGNDNFYASVGFERNFKKANLTLGININYYGSNYASFINSIKNNNQNSSVSIGPVIKYNNQDKFECSLNTSISYNTGKSNIGNANTNALWSHSHDFEATVFLPLKFELNTNVNMNFQPANSYFNSSLQVIKWNASIVKKLTKNDKTEIRLAVFDILNQNTGYNRYVTGNYISESSNNYIPRYGLLSFIWNFTHTNK